MNIDKKIEEIKKSSSLSISGLNLGERAFLLSKYEKFLYVAPDRIVGKDITKQLISLGCNAMFLESRLSAINLIEDNVFKSYANVLSSIASGECSALVITPEVLTQLIPEKKYFCNTIILKKGDTIDLGQLKKQLLDMGYTFETMVTEVGQFASRGDILDVFVPGQDNPYRINFFDDEIEKINVFSPINFVSICEIQSINIRQATIISCSHDARSKLIDDIKNSFDNQLSPTAKITYAQNIAQKIEQINENILSPFVMPFLSYFNSSIIDYFDTIFYDEPKLILDRVEQAIKDEEDIINNFVTAGELSFAHNKLIIKKPFNNIEDKKNIAFTRLTYANKIFIPQDYVKISSLTIPRYINNYSGLNADLVGYLGKGYDVTIYCGDEYTRGKLLSVLDVNSYVDLLGRFEIIDRYLPFSVGFEEEKFILIGTNDITNRSFEDKKIVQNIGYLPKVGENVVHEVHGIGKCIGIEKLKLSSSYRDYIIIEYAGGDILYVPSENVESLSAYTGSENPRYNKIGGADFYKTKQKAKESIKKMAFDLINLYSKKENTKGHKYSADNTLINEFINAFEFEYTDDQKSAVNDILNDMQSNRLMDRLICGDVGFGKTEVALVAAYKTILEGKQVAFIAPTTILCEQHYRTALSRMKNFVVNVEAINRLHSSTEQKKILERLKNGDIDIIVGTHRLLSKDVKFKDLGLLILDEEQRFGVEDKEKLRNLKVNIDVLSMSATPIPRTLYMSLIGVRDISYLQTPPKQRIPITTTIIDYSENLVKEACNKELSRNGQVLIIYNRVETIYDFASKIRKLLPQAKIGVAHGQMPNVQLEDVIFKVYNRQLDILISTVLIENGIDLPSANTLIVVDSDKLGLSQLYQLRGRIGRSNLSSYAYLTFAKNKVLTQEAYKRLDALMEYDKFGSGLKVAMRDLQIRGAGNILGREQHGHMDKIGYDLYFKLLEQAVKEIKGQKVEQDKKEIKIDISINAYIPDYYIDGQDNRIVYYSKISAINSEASRQQILSELKDIYGNVPDEVLELSKVAYIKYLAQNIFASKVIINDNGATIYFYPEEFINCNIYDKIKGEQSLSVNLKNTPSITFKKARNVYETQESVIKFLEKCQNLPNNV